MKNTQTNATPTENINMPFRYVPIHDTKNGTDTEACLYNGKLLAEGLRGVECTYVGKCSQGEIMDYTQFAPWRTHLSSVERYANGAQNFFVKSQEGEVVGYIIVRPLTGL